MVFKTEDPIDDSEVFNFSQVYSIVFRLFKIPHFRTFVILLLCIKLPFNASDKIYALELIEKGIGDSTVAMIAMYFVPVEII